MPAAADSEFAGLKVRSGDQNCGEVTMPEIRKIDSSKILCLEETGSWWQLGDMFERLEEFLERRRVPYKGDKLAILYDDPRDLNPEHAHFAAALELAGETTGDGEATVVLQPTGWVACEQFRGSYAQIRETYARLLQWIQEQGYRVNGPAKEYYLSGFRPADFRSGSEVEVEVQVPVDKPGA